HAIVAADATIAAVASTISALARQPRDSRKWAATAAASAGFGNDDAATRQRCCATTTATPSRNDRFDKVPVSTGSSSAEAAAATSTADSSASSGAEAPASTSSNSDRESLTGNYGDCCPDLGSAASATASAFEASNRTAAA